jgi:predicted RNA binding protein YcfA (HicA-like mRNA interferase family)
MKKYGKSLDKTKYSWYYSVYMPLSGKEMLQQFKKAGWLEISQKGSHVKIGKGNLREIIPMHKELKKGLEQKLLKRLKDEGGN